MRIHGFVVGARRLESRISRALDRAAENAVGAGAPEPLETAHAIVDAVERQVVSGGRDARLFPFNRVAISVLATSRDTRARFDALFASAPSLRDRVLDRLASTGCDARDLRVDLTYVGRAARGWE